MQHERYLCSSWNSACLSRCSRGDRPLVERYLEPGVFSERCTGKLPLRVDCIHGVEFGEVSGHRVLIKRGPGNRGPTECGTTQDRKSTRLNSSHHRISYAVFCLKKKKVRLKRE